jgi:hypothetical protein
MSLIDEQKYNSKSFRNFHFISQNGLNKYRFLHEFHRILTRSKSKTQKIEMKIENGKEGKEKEKEKEKQKGKGKEKEKEKENAKYYSRIEWHGKECCYDQRISQNSRDFLRDLSHSVAIFIFVSPSNSGRPRQKFALPRLSKLWHSNLRIEFPAICLKVE